MGDNEAHFLPFFLVFFSRFVVSGAYYFFFKQLINGISYQCYILQIDAWFGFIQEHQWRILRHELQEFWTLYLPAWETVIDVPL